MLSVLVVGFLLGMRHALEADHVAAVASLTGREPSLKRALRLGAAWGVGHTLTLFIVVNLVFLLDEGIPKQLVQTLETIVGVMLIMLGADVLRRLARNRIHFHIHDHDGSPHFHAHSHQGEKEHRISLHDHDHRMSWRALAVGLMHGLAGSAALVVLTVTSTDSIWLGMTYTALFGAGSILGMAVLSIVIAVPLGLWEHRLTGVHNIAMAVIGLVTIIVGGNLFLSNVMEVGSFS